MAFKKKARKKSLKTTGFNHNFALEQHGKSPLQKKILSRALEEVGYGAGSFAIPIIAFLSLETELVHPDQVLQVSLVL